ncbi:unnamed protein product [Amaranthus hypochondriacus]
MKFTMLLLGMFLKLQWRGLMNEIQIQSEDDYRFERAESSLKAESSPIDSSPSEKQQPTKPEPAQDTDSVLKIFIW